MHTLRFPALVSLFLTAVALLSTGCSIADSYHIPDGLKKGRSYTSIAGDIEVGRQATIRNARTVAGDIEIHEGGRVASLTTVAGRILLAPEVKVDGSVKTIAGDIEIGAGCTVTGDISTEVGHISIEDSVVQGHVTLSNGSLEITRTRLAGTLRVRYSDRENAKVAELTIGPGSEVATLVVEKKAMVRLRIHRTAKVGSIQGGNAEYYD